MFVLWFGTYLVPVCLPLWTGRPSAVPKFHSVTKRKGKGQGKRRKKKKAKTGQTGGKAVVVGWLGLDCLPTNSWTFLLV